MTAVEKDITSPFRVILSSSVAAKMQGGVPRPSLTERSGLGLPSQILVEVGGVMMGEHLEKHTFRVTGVSLTMGADRQYYFDPKEHQPFVDAFLAESSGRNGTSFIGHWHSHPSGSLTPSPTDLETLKNNMASPLCDLCFMVLLIVCLGENDRLGAEGVVLVRDSKTPSEIEVTIENGSTD